MCDEWTGRRGYADTVAGQILARCDGGAAPLAAKLPWWLGEDRFHHSHQSNLIRKDPDYYGPLFPGVPGDLPYWWPVQ